MILIFVVRGVFLFHGIINSLFKCGGFLIAIFFCDGDFFIDESFCIRGVFDHWGSLVVGIAFNVDKVLLVDEVFFVGKVFFAVGVLNVDESFCVGGGSFGFAKSFL